MITPDPAPSQPEDWQRELARAVSDPAELLRLLELPDSLLDGARRAAVSFPLRVTRHYLGLIRPGDPDDPLLRQVLPLDKEGLPAPGFVTDPVGDSAAALGDGLIHKYHGRILLVVTGACAIHCRYCFRRHYPYAEDSALRDPSAVLAHLRRMPEIREVILSGGDPLSLSDTRLQALLDGLEALPQLRRLRIHSRLPLVLPQRLTGHLVSRLAASRLGVSLVLHANHPRELAPALRPGLQALREAGVTLLNQSVLLRGVNDETAILAELSEALFDHGILPYYLHLLDPVAGSAHFAVSRETARALHRQLRALLPGYLLPRLVCEIPGEPSKRPMDAP